MPKRSKEERAIDVAIGERAKLRRRLLGKSQGDLASELGISFQQIQKAESGENAYSASRLYRVAQALNAPIDYFYEGLPPPTQTPHSIFEASESLSAQEALAREGARLTKAYLSIRDPETRKMIAELVAKATEMEP